MSALRGPGGRCAALAVALTIVLGGCGPTGPAPDTVGRGQLSLAADLTGTQFTVGAKPGVRHELLCEIALAALQSAGAGVVDACAGGTDARAALAAGTIDLYWEDTGTVTGRGLLAGTPAAAGTATGGTATVVTFDPAPLTVRGRFAAEAGAAARLNLRTLTDVQQLTLAGEAGKAEDAVTWCRLPGVVDDEADLRDVGERYRIAVRRPPGTDDGVGTGSADVRDPGCTVFLVDPLTPDARLTRLTDDRPDGAPAAGIVAPVMRAVAFERRPREIREVLRRVVPRLDDRTLDGMVRDVGLGLRPADVARDWVRSPAVSR